ncbi:hypothetical protein LO772_04865 [Yinghuangia sp. ASG 101]|uniref:hypothetical protein n=1 Tax=Yinghuangia sp. ASG 101 TaxID=2896848 RepID=UPI001E49F2F0|nr:hypothetical protein [Yinghuangia sp. ASG 101]UGQ12956.1 hypothetical protein LO772_04865 [Yinghuangia sp. ASG 101]
MASRVLAVFLAALLALVLVPFTAGKARAAGVSDIAAHLRGDPVYTEPGAYDVLPPATADSLRATIRASGKPVFVVAVPADSPLATAGSRSAVLSALRDRVGVPGVYAVAVGRSFDAAADPSVMSPSRLATLKSDSLADNQGNGPGLFTQFVDGAVGAAGSRASATTPGSSNSDSGTWVGAAVVAALAVVVFGGTMLVRRRTRRRRAAGELRALEQVRPTVDEDITAYGEALDHTAFDPRAPKSSDAMRADWSTALDSYERAKTAMRSARRPDDVRGVSEALDDGRFALATLDARRRGAKLPHRRQPCFFDPRHGVSVRDMEWAPPGGAPRGVPVCAADAARLEDGREPEAREVDTPLGRRPYWDAGPAYAPWAAGWYGGMLLPGLLIGTALGHAAMAPYAYGDPSFDGDPSAGGDWGGGFDGGGFGDGGGGGWGDAGGGF